MVEAKLNRAEAVGMVKRLNMELADLRVRIAGAEQNGVVPFFLLRRERETARHLDLIRTLLGV
jgi:hypothetical protein